jgi:apoptosis-stimulating of p53 protein 1
LSIAVAKVEALTRQLEELRRGRRGFGLTPQDATNQQQQQQPHSSVTRELEKLRRELMVSRAIMS